MAYPHEYTLATLTQPHQPRRRRRRGWFVALLLVAVGIGGTVVVYALAAAGRSPAAAVPLPPAPTTAASRVLSDLSPSETACMTIRAAIRSGDFDPDAMLMVGEFALRSSVLDIRIEGQLLHDGAQLAINARNLRERSPALEAKIAAGIRSTAAALERDCSRAGF